MAPTDVLASLVGGALGRRPDGELADAPGYRQFMPALMRSRNESIVYFDQEVRVDRTERFIAETRAAHPGLHATLFHVVLWAMAQTFDRHPNLNRFVAGGRLYQRDGIWISFTVKSELSNRGVLLEVKHRFDPTQSLPELMRDLEEAIAAARAGKEGLVERELDLFLRLPPPLRRGVVRLAGVANDLGLLPPSMIEGDPFFASAFVTNLGSIGLDAAFHHLYEHGTIPLFCVLGAAQEEVVVEDGEPRVARMAPLRFSYDERVEDGLYAAFALETLKSLIEDPAASGA
jgi:pyruvate/2-oxoglutarate dehydrogenase complex dihydrolipoamide acyltransferase (E2) component